MYVYVYICMYANIYNIYIGIYLYMYIYMYLQTSNQTCLDKWKNLFFDEFLIKNYFFNVTYKYLVVLVIFPIAFSFCTFFKENWNKLIIMIIMITTIIMGIHSLK